jgi:hypothetical protein
MREGVCPCLYSPVGWTAVLGSNRLETMVEMRRRGRLEAVTRSWSHLEVGPGRPAPLVSLRASASFSCLLVSSRTFTLIFAEFQLDLVRFIDSFLAYLFLSLKIHNSQKLWKLLCYSLKLLLGDGSGVFLNLSSHIHRGLSLQNSKYSEWYIRFDRLDELFAMMCSNSSLEMLLYSEMLNILQNK